MRKVVTEYNQVTGEILCVRSFDCAEVPTQPCNAGNALLQVDIDLEPKMAEDIRINPHRYRVNDKKKDFELKDSKKG